MALHDPETLVTKLNEELLPLQENIRKLVSFRASNDHKNLPLSEQLDLRDQIEYMRNYSIVLNRRLTRAVAATGVVGGVQ